ncbi:MAG: SRPBCC family protein [Hyphomonadaceae bacterium]
MRWFLGLLLVIAVVLGAAYAVGRFLLPNTLEVTRSVTVERPRSAVFAMVNDLRIAKEWSPFYARDPDADYVFSGDPGEGQNMRWTSDVRDIGAGRMSIVRSTNLEEVESILEMGDRATLTSRLMLRPSDEGSSVNWTMSAQCAEGSINVPCRYMNLVMRGRIEAELDSGLARLKTLAEQLPNVDFEGFEITAVPVEPQDVLFVDVTIASDRPTFADRSAAETDGIGALNNFIASTDGQVSRPDQLVRVFPSENGQNGLYRFSVGYPYTGAAPPRLVGVRTGRTPGGAALRLEYQGRRSELPRMYRVLDAYMQAHRISARPATEAWEIVRAPTAGAEGGTAEDPIEHAEIYFPIE